MRKTYICGQWITSLQRYWTNKLKKCDHWSVFFFLLSMAGTFIWCWCKICSTWLITTSNKICIPRLNSKSKISQKIQNGVKVNYNSGRHFRQFIEIYWIFLKDKMKKQVSVTYKQYNIQKYCTLFWQNSIYCSLI